MEIGKEHRGIKQRECGKKAARGEQRNRKTTCFTVVSPRNRIIGGMFSLCFGASRCDRGDEVERARIFCGKIRKRTSNGGSREKAVVLMLDSVEYVRKECE